MVTCGGIGEGGGGLEGQGVGEIRYGKPLRLLSLALGWEGRVLDSTRRRSTVGGPYSLLRFFSVGDPGFQGEACEKDEDGGTEISAEG